MKLVEKAIRAIESGKVEEGLAYLAKAEKEANHESKFAIAEVYHELGHIESAKKIIDDLLMLYPDEGSLYVFAAELLIDLDEEDEAIELLLEINENDPTFLQAQLLLADLYQMQSLDEVAEQKLLAAANKAPNEMIISYGLGEFYLGRGDYIKSIPYLKKVVHSKEKIPNISVELLLAEAYSASGQFEDAMMYYEKGLSNHMEPSGLFGYAFTAYQLGDMVIAIKQFEDLKELDPDYSSLYPYLAKAYEAEGKLDEAVDTLKAGLAIDEYNEQLYIHAGKLSFKRQDPQSGETFLRKAIALNPSNTEAVQTLAAYLKHTEQYESLHELMNHLKEYSEEDSLYTWYEASALKELDDYEKAHKLYEEIESVFSEDLDFLEEYGYFLLEFGLREKAISMFTKLLKLNPENGDIQMLLQDLQ